MRAGDGPQQRRLAGAVSADQREDFAFRHAQVDIPHSLEETVPSIELLDRQQAHVRPSPR